MSDPYYEEGGISLYLGDCREILPKVIGPLALLTDMPYGLPPSAWLNRVHGKNGSSRLWGKSVSWDTVSQELFDLAVSSAEESIIWGANNYNLIPCSRWLIWDKKQNTRRSECEMAWTTLTGGHKIFRMSRIDAYFNKAIFPKEHPTEKPIQLLSWCIGFFKNGEPPILDPFCGSGTTLIAAKQLGRKAIGIEIEEKYCEVAAKRLMQAYVEISE